MTGRHERVAIESSLQAYWKHQFSPEVVTIFPGMLVETSKLTSWAEVWVQSSLRRRGRATSLPMVNVSAVVHLFSRHGQQPGVLRRMMDEACGLLSSRTLLVRDFQRAGSPVVGYLKLYEAQARTMVEGQGASRQPGLSHAVVTCEGMFGGVGES